MNEHREEPEDDDDSGLRPAPLELQEGERQSDARHRGRHDVQEGCQQSAKNEYHDEALCTLTLGAQEVQDVLEEKEPSRRKPRVHDTVEHGVNVVAPHNDDDEDANTLEGLLYEGRDE